MVGAGFPAEFFSFHGQQGQIKSKPERSQNQPLLSLLPGEPDIDLAFDELPFFGRAQLREQVLES